MEQIKDTDPIIHSKLGKLCCRNQIKSLLAQFSNLDGIQDIIFG